MKENLAKTMQIGKEEKFTVVSPEDPKDPVIQICQNGKLLLSQTKKLKDFVIRDQNGITRMSTNQNQEKPDSESLDEEDIKRGVERLQVGESITAVFSDDSKLGVTFDQIITLESGIDQSNHSFRLSQLLDSSLISGASSHDFKEKSKNKIELELTGKEIVMLFNVAALGKEERKKLLAGLPIIDHIVSVANIHMHYFSKKWFSVCWDDLLKRVRDLLEKGDVSWFEKSFSLENDRGKNIQPFIENLLKEIITPVPKVLFEEEGVREAEFTLDGTEAKVKYLCDDNNGDEIIELESSKTIFTRDNAENLMEIIADGKIAIVNCVCSNTKYRIEHIEMEGSNRAKIIDIESAKKVFERDDVRDMKIAEDGKTLIIVYCCSNKVEIIDIKSAKIVFKRDDVRDMKIDVRDMKLAEYWNWKMYIVNYCNNRVEITDLESHKILKMDNVKNMKVTEDGSKVMVLDRNNKLEILGLKDYDREIDFVTFNPEQLLFVFNLSQDPDCFARDKNNEKLNCFARDKNNEKLIWQSFESEVQKKLKRSYFPAIDFQ